MSTTIGILKEENDHRVAFLPEHLEALLKLKVRTIIEEGAGNQAYADDGQYRAAGAEVLGRQEVISQSDILVSISPPDPDKTSGFRTGQVLVSVFNPFVNKALVTTLADRGLTTLSLDFIPRTTRAQAMDILSSMATVAGYKAVLAAASAYPGFFPMFMSAAGTIKPARVLILGAGVAGLQALSVARKLGAVVEVFDVRKAVKEEVHSLGGRFVEVEGAVEDSAAGGYAVEQTDEYKQKQTALIQAHTLKSDIVITTAQVPGRKAPLLISRETIEGMVPGSVIVDLAAASGGNTDCTQNDKTVVVNGVTIIGKSDFPSAMPRDASRMFGRNLINFFKILIHNQGETILNFDDDIISTMCLTYNGVVINERIK